MEDNKKILFIEDDQLISDLVSRKFLSEEITTVHAQSGEKALEILETDPKPLLILLDIRLPGIDGFTVLEKIKQNESTKDIPVIVFSNFSEESGKKRASDLGAKEYVVKVSRSLDEMAELVKSYLELTAKP
ncbi:MAG: response regulator [Candidatus Paceibacterota bacterium]